MSIFTGLKVGGSALTAQRLRMDVIANNIANAETTRSADGKPYRRQQIVFTSTPGSTARPMSWRGDQANRIQQGVRVAGIYEDETPPRMVYDPGHPDADADGYVAYPDIDVVTEMTDMMAATRAYEANVTAINTAKNMALKALEILRS